MPLQYLSVVQNIQESIKYKTQNTIGHFHAFQKIQNFNILKIFNKPFLFWRQLPTKNLLVQSVRH